MTHATNLASDLEVALAALSLERPQNLEEFLIYCRLGVEPPLDFVYVGDGKVKVWLVLRWATSSAARKGLCSCP